MINTSKLNNYIYKTIRSCKTLEDIKTNLIKLQQLTKKLYIRNKINIDEVVRLDNYINKCLSDSILYYREG